MQGLIARGLTVLLGMMFGVSPAAREAGVDVSDLPARNLGADLVDAREIVEKILPAEEGESVERGSVVLLVEPHGPVDRAGLQSADAIVEAAGAPVDGTMDLLRVLGQRPIGARVRLTYVRDGQVRTTFLDVEGPPPGPQALLGL
jgi:S1-C subfamily serine protease